MKAAHYRLLSMFILFILAITACSKATGTTSDGIDLSGTYSISGTNPDGSEYSCMLDIVRDRDVYHWYWYACGDYEGIGVQQETIVSVAWGAYDCNIVAYKIHDDGSLKAIWTPIKYTSLGSEIAIPVGHNSLEGAYMVTGTNPDGSDYEGTLDITKNGGVFEVFWDTSDEFNGTGILQDNILSVAYGAPGCSAMSYLVHEDQSLESTWVYVGETSLGTEVVSLLEAGSSFSTATSEPMLGEVGGTISDAPARPSAGCGSEPPAFPGATTTMDIQVDGLDRVYLLHLPTEYNQTEPTSLVMAFHGYTDSAGGMESGTGLSYHADEHNYIAVYPHATHFLSDSGYISSWNDLSCSGSPGPEGSICSKDATKYPFPSDCAGIASDECNWCTCNDDLGYIEQVLDELQQNLCIDLNRVYATGMSNGGMFVHRLGCNLAARFAAIAPVSGTLARGFNCAPETSDPISIMNIHGRDDDYVDVTGAESTDGYFYTPIDDVMALWASPESQNCSSKVTPYLTIADGIRGLECTQHADCETGAEIVSCWWDAGHAWPGGVEPWGNDLIWDFFLKHAKNIQP